MKRLLLSFTLIATLSTFTSFASESNVPAGVMESFHHLFGQAQNITTQETASFYRIGFTLNGSTRFAYYDLSGNLVVTANQISQNELKEVLRTNLKNRFPEAEIKELYILQNESGTEYCAVVKNGNKEITLQAKGKKWQVVNIEQGTRNIE